MDDYPNFKLWERATLDNFARDAYQQMQDDKGLLAQQRIEFKRVMQQLQDITNLMKDDWK